MKRTITLALSCLFLGTAAFAQQKTTLVKRTCDADVIMKERQKRNPEAKKYMLEMETYTQKRVQEMRSLQGKIENGVYKIPVVVHILYTNSTNNISTSQIQSQLDVLNADFRRTNSDATNKWSQAADTKIEFYLAKVDPNGNATTGVTRKQVTKSTWNTSLGDSDRIKKSSQGGVDPWDTAEYLNMWIVDNIVRNTATGTATILGFAQFPWDTDKSTDGVVMADQYFGTNGTAKAPFDGGRTTTHEVGHFFGLRHIWGDAPCGTDDFVSDTPESDAANYGCQTGHNSCGSEDMVQNYMDYSDDSCMNLFTAGQRDRMHTYLAAGGARRALALSDKAGSGGGGTNPPATCSSTISSFPYAEGFESGDAWTQVTGDAGNWVRKSGSTPSSGTGPSSATQGSYYMFLEASSNSSTGQIGSNATAILESACFDLAGKSSASFTFKNHMYGNNVGSLKVQGLKDGQTSWTDLWSDSGNKGNQWNSVSVNLSAYLGGKVKLRLVGTTGNGWSSDIAVDDLAVTTGGGSSADTQAPTAPGSLATANVAQTTLTLNWNASSDNVGVTGYDVYQGSSKIGSTTNTTVNVTGLTAATAYTFSVRAKDAAGNESSASSVNVTTLSNALTYCSSKGNRSSYEWIDNVELGGMTNATGDNGGYEDFTAKVATLAQGSSNQMVVSAGFRSTAYTEHWAVWIDFNQNGTFDASEKVVTGSSSSANNLTATVAVPAGATLGSTRMRVSMKYNAAQTACETFDDGEVEDYTVNIVSSARQDNPVSADRLGNETALDFVAYPNPASNFVQVKLASKNDVMNYKIVNTIGRVVKAGRLNGNSINISDLNTGMYILEVNDGQKSLTTKLMKK
ncbi:GEVED domain-containing protein [uncultured Tenacibaculum sp.]|uniref:GEVED domain-containing protein n=1 Tax=uncultured Tenacibaculum sp. TaxID=174713 RepID=UPI002637027C|nr:GEVED domain-containing protein [uncultured Tenacibaculum sp.]